MIPNENCEINGIHWIPKILKFSKYYKESHAQSTEVLDSLALKIPKIQWIPKLIFEIQRITNVFQRFQCKSIEIYESLEFYRFQRFHTFQRFL